MSESQLRKMLDSYFGPSKQSSVLSGLISFAQQFATDNKQLTYVRMLFESMQSSIDKDNLRRSTKKYFILVNKLLLKSDLPTGNMSRYRRAVSQEIVKHYMIMLKQILKLNVIDATMTDVILDFKVYRLKWAKRITQEAYYQLHKEALKKLNFRLDKGIPKQQISKIEAAYAKRGFSRAEIDRYINRSNRLLPARRRSSQPDPKSSQQSEQLQRSPNRGQWLSSNERPCSTNASMMSHHSSYFPNNSFAMPQTSYPVYAENRAMVYPQHPTQNAHRYPPRAYLPHPYTTTTFNTNGFYPHNNYYHTQTGPHQSGPHQSGPHELVSHQPGSHELVPHQLPCKSSEFQTHRDISQPEPKSMKVRQIVNQLRQSSSCECRICGAYFSTDCSYQKHLVGHFEQGQRNFEAIHSRSNSRRQPMPQIEEWVKSSKIHEAEVSHILPIEQDTGANVRCKICKGQMMLIWSDYYDSWAYEDAILAKIGSVNSFCHYTCYQTVEQVLKKDLW